MGEATPEKPPESPSGRFIELDVVGDVANGGSMAGINSSDVWRNPSVAAVVLENNKYRTRSRCLTGGVAVLAVVVLALVIALAVTLSSHSNSPTPSPTLPSSRRYDSATLGPLALSVRMSAMLATLRDLEAQANLSDGSRSVVSGASASSARYMEEAATKLVAGVGNVVREPFTINYTGDTQRPSLVQASPSPVRFEYGRDFTSVFFSGSGRAQGVVVPAGYGCTLADFPTTTLGNVALVVPGVCPLQDKAVWARRRKAAAMIVQMDRSSPLYLQHQVFFPVVAVSPALRDSFARGFAEGSPVTVEVETFATATLLDSANVVATLPGVSPGVVMIGAHIDSVLNGPGANDNGSGSALLLEVLEQVIALEKAGRLGRRNTLRVAWWGAEELGLLGSRYHVEQHRDLPTVYLNFDMIASPNYIRGVFDGASLRKKYTNELAAACGVVSSHFTEHFQAVNVSYKPIPFTGRSDYQPFLDAGIPVGGLETGSDELKTLEDRRLFGGSYNVPYDPCYHKRCDTTENINVEVYEDMARAAAAVIQRLLETESLTSLLKDGSTDAAPADD